MADQLDDFGQFEASVQEIFDVLKEGHKEEQLKPLATPPQSKFEHIDVDNVRLTVREDRTVINKKATESKVPANGPDTMDPQCFMREMEKDANERAAARAKRESEAQQLRSQGHLAFRQGNYEKAILQYSKAIELIKDSAITYSNRALSYIKLKNYKRALEDCDYVLENLSESNLRAWLYRATAYKRLNDVTNYEASLRGARQHNPEQTAYIDKYIRQLEVDI